MTLFRQLLIFTLTLFFVLLIVIWVEKLQSTRSFLVDQMESHAQDTATSLGLSLSPVMLENDIATVDTMLNAVFDRGYYKVIILSDVFGKVVSERVLQVKTANVPDWFIDLISLETPGAESLIMAGWNQAGTLYVEIHPGYAYQTLWQTAVKITSYFFLTWVLVIVFGSLGLRVLLRPLTMVEKQAEAICRKEYWIQEKLPKTRELLRVVESMNKMTGKVRDMFAEQLQTAERLRKNNYRDQLTGLGNRRYLTGQVEASLQIEKDAVSGAFLLIQLHELQKLNDEKGFAAGDELLKKVATIIRGEVAVINNVALARLAGGDFAVFMSEIWADDAYQVAESITAEIARLAVEKISSSDNLVHVGGVTYEHHPSFADLLAEADACLRIARQLGPNKWQVRTMETGQLDVNRGRNWWRETLDTTLGNEDIVLYGQAVRASAGGRNLHREIFARIVLETGELVSAAGFIPLAERLQMVSRFDRLVLKKALQLGGEERIAVNVSPSSLAEQDFFDWLLAELGRLPDKSLSFAFEFAEFGAVQYLEIIRTFAHRVKECGHAVGLDHFGQSFSNFGYLKSLQPDYVKIDRGFTRELVHNQSDSHFFIDSLCSVAHSLDIQVIAEGVEELGQMEILQELNVDGIQGYFVEKPRAIG